MKKDVSDAKEIERNYRAEERRIDKLEEAREDRAEDKRESTAIIVKGEKVAKAEEIKSKIITIIPQPLEDVALDILATVRGSTRNDIVNEYFHKSLVEDLKTNQSTLTENQKSQLGPFLR